MSAVLALVVVTPLLGALLLAILGPLARWLAAAACVGAMGAATAGAVAVLVHVATTGEAVRHRMGGWAAPTGIEYRVDLLGGIVLVMVAGMGFLAAIWMRRSLAREVRRAGRVSYQAVFLLFATGLLGMTATADVFNLYVFLEIASIAAYVLVAMGRDRRALVAGYTYLVVGSIGATFFLLGIGHLYMATGTLSVQDLADRLPDAHATTTVRTAFAFLTVGLAMKMALFPLHGWQPGAYTHAPPSMSLFLAATSTKVAAYAFYRIAYGVFGPEMLRETLPAITEGLLVMAAFAAVVGPLLATWQGDLKRMLAYSSVGQIGHLMLGGVLGNVEGLTGSLVHFWNHAAAKGALFAVAGALVFRTRSSRVADLAGMGRSAPLTALVMTVAGLSLVGVPLTGGFVTKWYLASGALSAGRAWIVPVILLSSMLTAIYVWRCLQLVWFASREPGHGMVRDVPWSMRLPTLALGAACLLFGIWASLPVGLASAAARDLLGR